MTTQLLPSLQELATSLTTFCYCSSYSLPRRLNQPCYQLGAFSMVEYKTSLNERERLHALSGKPHTLEFVSLPYSNSWSRLSDADQDCESQYHSESNPRIDHTGGDDEKSVAAKKAKLQHADQAQVH